ncbi:MAG: hypothetical protein B6D37_05175 [Sphingobacteriales bacterium UTBCD1]|nr:MAG: hypothetical protein B6D37_05175 [Sphingobacteriales bacterium UTBCD1]
MKLFKRLSIGFALSILIYGVSGCGPGTYVSGGIQYSNPAWAPAYYPGVRYYYIPDIETYYDLSDDDFVYLNDGQWMFSPYLPPMYSGFDLYSCFVVSLNVNVYHPWLHHQYYVSHYPRYYYHNVYHNNYASVRGFNENSRKPIMWKSGEREQTLRLKPSQGNRLSMGNRVQSPKPPQMTNYYGKRIGQPVRVRPQMRQTRPQVRESRPMMSEMRAPAPARVSAPRVTRSHRTP